MRKGLPSALALIKRQSLNTSLICFFFPEDLLARRKLTGKKASWERRKKEMKRLTHLTPVGAQTTFVEVWQWGQELERLHARIAPRFARPEPRHRALAYCR